MGGQTATFELSPRDADENGVVWLEMEVERVGALSIGEVPAPWHIRWLRVGLEGEVAGPPRRPTAQAVPDEKEERRPPADARKNNNRKNNKKQGPTKPADGQ